MALRTRNSSSNRQKAEKLFVAFYENASKWLKKYKPGILDDNSKLIIFKSDRDISINDKEEKIIESFGGKAEIFPLYDLWDPSDYNVRLMDVVAHHASCNTFIIFVGEGRIFGERYQYFKNYYTGPCFKSCVFHNLCIPDNIFAILPEVKKMNERDAMPDTIYINPDARNENGREQLKNDDEYKNKTENKTELNSAERHKKKRRKKKKQYSDNTNNKNVSDKQDKSVNSKNNDVELNSKNTTTYNHTPQKEMNIQQQPKEKAKPVKENKSNVTINNDIPSTEDYSFSDTTYSTMSNTNSFDDALINPSEYLHSVKQDVPEEPEIPDIPDEYLDVDAAAIENMSEDVDLESQSNKASKGEQRDEYREKEQQEKELKNKNVQKAEEQVNVINKNSHENRQQNNEKYRTKINMDSSDLADTFMGQVVDSVQAEQAFPKEPHSTLVNDALNDEKENANGNINSQNRNFNERRKREPMEQRRESMERRRIPRRDSQNDSSEKVTKDILKNKFGKSNTPNSSKTPVQPNEKKSLAELERAVFSNSGKNQTEIEEEVSDMDIKKSALTEAVFARLIMHINKLIPDIAVKSQAGTFGEEKYYEFVEVLIRSYNYQDFVKCWNALNANIKFNISDEVYKELHLESMHYCNLCSTLYVDDDVYDE